MATFIQARVHGVKEIEAAFKNLDAKLKGQTLRKAIAEGKKVYLNALKAAAPKETGLLRKSLGTRAKTYKKGLIASQTIGPRSGFRQEMVVKIKDKKGKWVGSKKQMRDPRRYAHILEKRNPWIRPVFEAYTGQVISVVSGKLKMELELAIKASSTAGKVK
jgi:hypothetical protein